MSDMHDMIRRYSIANDSKLKSVTSPLMDHMKIPYFSYFQTHADGSFAFLSNYTEQVDFYFSSKLYLDNPYHTHPDLIHSGCVLTDHTEDDAYLESVRVAKEQYTLNNSFLIVQKKYNMMECFFFATKHDSDFSHYYFNYIEKLKSFGRYFARENGHLIKRILADGYNMASEKGEAFLNRDSALPLSTKHPQHHPFSKALYPLTPQEQRSLELFREGHSAQATAAIMGLSRRTVEHYCESIKEKLNCHSKWDLLQC